MILQWKCVWINEGAKWDYQAFANKSKPYWAEESLWTNRENVRCGVWLFKTPKWV